MDPFAVSLQHRTDPTVKRRGFLGPDETGDDDNERFAKKGKVEPMLLGVKFLDGRIVGPARFHGVPPKEAGTIWIVSTPTSEWRGAPVEFETRGLVDVRTRPHVLEGVNGTEGNLTFDSLLVKSDFDHIFSSVEPWATEQRPIGFAPPRLPARPVLQGAGLFPLLHHPTCRRAPPADAPGERRTTATSSRRSMANMSTAGSGAPGRAEPR